MTTTHYDDGFITLKGHPLFHFDVGREMPAWVDLLSPTPMQVSFQDRSLLTRLIALVSNRKGGAPLTIGLASDDLYFAAPMLWAIFGDKLPLKTGVSLPYAERLRQNPLTQEIAQSCPFQVAPSPDDVVNLMLASAKGPCILLLDAKAENLCRKVIDHAIGHGQCHLLIRDYCKGGHTNHYVYGRDRGMRALENADGSGEFFVM